ncbi:MAG: N-acetyl-gamma-glutamyl-phosphate reductase [Bacteroidetes bacterium]|nr:N-acetyl-gamma-glutamyl-phosphate reductase [Bacteroidota bacterium]
MIKVAIVGGSGYVGNILLKILLNHEYVDVKIVTSTSQTGKKICEVFPEIENELVLSKFNYKEINKMDVVFLAVPHGKAKSIVPKLKCKIIDFTSDHRLTEIYGLPEIFGKKIKESKFIANPGCYASACILATYPIQDLIKYTVFDCISGYSGGGNAAKYKYQENIIAYKLSNHFQIKELSNILNFNFSFTPHVVNTFSGLMCTAHIFLNNKIKLDKIINQYKEYYKDSFTKIIDSIPSTKNVVNTPYCNIGGFELDKNNQLVIVSVIDNLYKGAATQAIENMNLMFKLDHKEGLKHFVV